MREYSFADKKFELYELYDFTAFLKNETNVDFNAAEKQLMLPFPLGACL